MHHTQWGTSDWVTECPPLYHQVTLQHLGGCLRHVLYYLNACGTVHQPSNISKASTECINAPQHLACSEKLAEYSLVVPEGLQRVTTACEPSMLWREHAPANRQPVTRPGCQQLSPPF
jgi:hypothetical protein